MIPRNLKLPGKALPPAIPLVHPLSSSSVVDRESGDDDDDHDGQSHPAKLQVNEEAVELLATVKKPVAVLFVCGPYRTGKSYVLSRLLGATGTFELGHSMDPCTRGIWLSTTALECDEYVLLLCDTEGIGSVDGDKENSEYQLNLLVLSTLLSSTLLYNSSEVPQASDIEQMSVFTHLTTCVAVNKDESGVSKPEDLQAHFPKFVWLLRNVVHLPEDENGEDIPLGTYIESRVATSSEQSRLVMKTIQSSFPSIEYHYLSPPSADPEHMANLDHHWDELEDDFKEKMEEIQQYLFTSIRIKLSYDLTTSVTGSDLAVLLKDHVEALNTPGCLPNLEGSWMAIMKLKLDAVSSQMVAKYTREIEEKTAGKMPMAEEIVSSAGESESDSVSLMQIHWSTFDECCMELKQAIDTLLPDHVMNEELRTYSQSVLTKFSSLVANFGANDLLNTEGPVGGVLLRLVRENHQLSEKMCVELWDNILKESGIRNKAMKALNHSKAVDINSELATLVEEYKEKAVGPAKQKVLDNWQSTNDISDMLSDLPGPPVNVRLVGKKGDRRKIRWDPPIINPGAAQEYTVEVRGKKRWKEVATTTECWAVLEKQKKKYSQYRVTAWNTKDREHNKGQMEEPFIFIKKPKSTVELLSYV